MSVTYDGENCRATAAPWLRSALAEANIPTLACLLVQLTGDQKWIEAPYSPTRTRGLDDNDDGGLPSAIQADIRATSFDALTLWFAGTPPSLPNPDDALLCKMMGVSLGETIPLDYAPMIRHELALPPAEPLAAATTPQTVPAGFQALIIGAGISGICAAVAFEAAGIAYTILERSDHLGGVWFENRYPGAACDVPSHLYSFSFEPYAWSRFFAGSREIHHYLEAVADRRHIRQHIRFRTDVKAARWCEADRRWDVDILVDHATPETLRANIIISGVGAFNKPMLPKVSGIESFLGPSVHTARYPAEGLDLAGRHVVLVGNGASAMQVAPAIAKDVESLTIVQRSPQWVAPFPKFGQSIPDSLRKLLSEVAIYRRWYRLRLSWAFNDKLYEALQRDPAWAANPAAINAINDAHRRGLTAYMESELGEARHLLPKVLPSYPPFGKRMLLDNGWFRTLARSNVRHVVGAVAQVKPHSIVTSDGAEHKADVLIWATGFDVVNLLAPMQVIGVAGRELHQEWDGDDARAYLGTVVPGFPNFFCLYGPNTQFGHGGSLISVLERQMHYIMSLLQQMFARNIKTVSVRRSVYEAYNARVDDVHARMIWTLPSVGGYYRNSKGRVVVNNPFRVLDVWRMTDSADIEEYELSFAAP